jgi:hypothetical protein
MFSYGVMYLDVRNHSEPTVQPRRDFRSLLFLWNVDNTLMMSNTEGINDWLEFKNVVHAGVYSCNMCDNIGSAKAAVYSCVVR